MLKRVRTTVWETSDGKRFADREAASEWEKVIRLSDFIRQRCPLFVNYRSAADELARDIVQSRSAGFVVALLPTSETSI